MKRFAMIAGLVLAACGGGVAVPDVARYDFGDLAPVGKPGGGPPLATVDVHGASWMSGPDMHFRLAYAESQQRRSYAESRWVAPPTELLETFLKRRLVFGQAADAGGGCRLQVALEELEQRFDAPQSSRVVLAARVQLISVRSTEILGRKAFQVLKPAPAADARGGAAAARDAVQALADDLEAWLGELARRQPAIAERCRA